MGIFIENPDDILNESIRQLQLSTNISRYTPGAKAQALLLSINKQYRKALTSIDLASVMAMINGARGIFLDYIGELVGVKRERPKKAKSDKAARNFKFYTYAENFGAINEGQPIQILKGQRIYTDPNLDGKEISFFSTEDILLPENINYGYISVEASADGKAFNIGPNTAVNHNVTNYTDAANSSLLVTNLGAVDSGDEEEDDDRYRYRIINNRLTGEAANSTAIRLVILSTPGIADYRADPYKRGIGTVDIIVQSSTGYTSQDLIDQIQERIDTIAKAEGLHFYIRGPKEIGIQVYLTVTYKSGVVGDIKRQNEELYLTNLRNYLFSLGMGFELIINDLIPLFPITEVVRSIGEPNKPLDYVYIFKSSTLSDRRSRSLLLENYITKFDEKLIPEISVESPLIIRRA